MTQTDSRISEKTQSNCNIVSLTAHPTCTAGVSTNLEEAIVTNDPLLEDEVPKGSDHETADEAIQPKLPCFFSLSCSCIYAGHQEDEIKG